METHRRYLDKAGIAYLDDRKRRADFHALRHTYGSLLAKSGIAPRVAMALMRHSDIRLTMNVYTDPRIFDLAGAVEKLPTLPAHIPQKQTAKATGTDGPTSTIVGRSESVSGQQAGIGNCSADTGGQAISSISTLTLVAGGNRQQKTPSGWDGAKERVKGVEPSTFTLAT